MGAIQLLGMTHYPPFCWADEHMAGLMHMIRRDPGIPDDAKDPARWNAAMRAEWGDDGGVTAAAAHRSALIDGFDRVRADIEAFEPDLLLLWGDDQYENFTEDLIPPFSILAYADRDVYPYRTRAVTMFPPYWDEPEDTVYRIKGRPDVARQLTADLLGDGFDVAYAYRPLHDQQLPHAFLNTVLFLDHRRQGFPWPVICMPINCYGRKVVSAQGGWKPISEPLDLDPPSPPPWRLMDLGAAVARHMRQTDVRVSIIASSSWSHAFLTDHTWRMHPDIEADRVLYDALVARRLDPWEAYTTEQIEHAGQHEVLNWFALAGAVRELGAELDWSEFVETWIFNSNKVFAAWSPVS